MASVADLYGRSRSSDRLVADGGSLSAICVIADPIGSSYQLGRQKNRNKIIGTEGGRAKRTFPGQNDPAESLSMAGVRWQR